jgi:RimJ/RimL family protein N-acetyltransferase
MIVGEHTVIRGAEPDDAAALRSFYNPAVPRCCLLDQRREPLFPNTDELREVLAQKEMGRPVLFATEDKTGVIRGFCSVRSVNLEASYGETILLLHEDADYATPLASEAMDFVTRQAFVQYRLNKLLAHALDSEQGLRDCLLRYGFQSAGMQREVLFTLGRWSNVETFTLFRVSGFGSRVQLVPDPKPETQNPKPETRRPHGPDE